LLVPPFGNISRRRQALSSFLLRIVNDWNLKQEISDVETARIAYKKRQVIALTDGFFKRKRN